MKVDCDLVFIASHLINVDKKSALFVIQFLMHYHKCSKLMAKEIVSQAAPGHDLPGRASPDHIIKNRTKPSELDTVHLPYRFGR
jgi:hypothetical protein